MPHLTLEHTSNVRPTREFDDLFEQLHAVLAENGVKIANCKSRAMERSRFYVAEGDHSSAFVHLDVRFMEGRSPESKQTIGQKLLGALRECFVPPSEITDLQITVEIRDIERQAYFKFPDGTLNYK